MSSLAFLVTELQSLASETRRKHPEVREAAEKSLALLKSSPEHASANLAADGPYVEDLLRPIFMGCATKNVKVISIALGALQRLITLRAVSINAVPAAIQTMNDCMSQGVDIQLKILQTLLSLITNLPAIHGRLLADALLLCFKLHESRTTVVSSTAAATLRQLVMFVVDKVVEEDRHPPPTTELEPTTLPDGTTQELGPAAHDAFAIFEDLCLLGNGEHPHFLQLEHLHKTFALELIESVLTNYHELFHKHPELLLLLRHHLCPLLLKALSERAVFPLTLRGTRVVFILLKQFAPELPTEAEVFLTLLVKFIGGDSDMPDARPGWMRVLALEIMRGLCGDAEFMRGVWTRYDAAADMGVGAARVFTPLVAALQRLISSRPALLGVSAEMLGAADGHMHALPLPRDGVAGLVATAASATVSNVVGMIGTDAGLSVQAAAMKVQCIDQLDKADAPPIPDAYPCLLGIQCLVALADGLAAYVLPLYNALSRASSPNTLPSALDPDTLPASEPAAPGLRAARGMLAAGWPALLAGLAQLLSANLAPPLFGDVLGALAGLARAAGALALATPRDALLAALARAALPPRVVAAREDDPAALTSTLGPRNLACLRALVGAAGALAGALGAGWFAVLEALQNAEYVLAARAPPGTPVTPMRPQHHHPHHPPLQQQHPLLADAEPEAVLAAVQRLFDASKALDDAAFRDFVQALCRLSADMVGMQSGFGASGSGSSGLDVGEDDGAPPVSPSESVASLGTPRSEKFGRRRVSGIHIPRTLRSGDFGIARLGGVALLNIQRLVFRPPDVAWDATTAHLLGVLQHPGAPPALRAQAARTLDDILGAVPRALAGAPPETQAPVQERVLNALAAQISLDGGGGATELRRMGLEALHTLLEGAGHTLLVGWGALFDVLGGVCAPRGVVERGYAPLIKAAFQCMTLACDALPRLDPPALRRCIVALGRFGAQADTNIALTAAESLFWGVSDAVQAKRREAALEREYSALWMDLLLELLGLCGDARPEVRAGAIQTLFRTLQLYGATLSLETWDECVWRVALPLLDALAPRALEASAPATSSSPDAAPPPDGAWADSLVVALQSLGAVLAEFLVPKIMRLPTFAAAWDALLAHVRAAFGRGLGAPALRCLERALRAAEAAAGEAELRDGLVHVWTRAWDMCDEVGAVVVARERVAPFSQESLVALVDVVKCARAISRALDGKEWPLERVARLMAILKGVLMYPYSPDYRPDIDALSPVQAIVMGAVEGIELAETGVAAHALRDLAEYATLAFIASFDVPSLPTRTSVLSVSVSTSSVPAPPQKRITYIALSKMCMPRLAELFLRFRERDEMLVDATLEAVLAAYAVPIKLKYDCPPASKFGKDKPLWKTATECFLRVVREVGPRVDALGSKLPDARVESIWRQVIDVYRGGILADCSAADNLTFSEQEEEENFDLSLITSLEVDVVPCLGDIRVPDYLITQLAKVLQQGSQLREFEPGDDYPYTPITPLLRPHERSLSWDNKEDPQDDVGSTALSTAVSRERFSYWCFDLLFLICSNASKDHETSRRRVAALSLPALIGRCRTTLAGYVADERLRGNLPFPRVREEELLYVLHKLQELHLWSGSLWAALSETPSKYATEQPAIDAALPPSELVADAVKRSPRAHVFHFYSVLCEIASVPRKAPSAWVMSDRLLASTARDTVATRPGSRIAAGGLSPNRLVALDARTLARECLKEVGHELGVPR
ncbi:hypothetical protein BC834DRAFT_827343 [Gloeopeniophorella convolvens]|nr:hypothetical protein BC834DRAFT_827343 [Gloeopeniophorella convolvens]